VPEPNTCICERPDGGERITNADCPVHGPDAAGPAANPDAP
jgi:hypothetical protein